MNAAGLWSLANAPGTPRDVKVDVTQLTNDTTLKWTVDPAAAGYEVVWRPTIEPVWTHVVPVGKVGTTTITGFSKDNVPDRCPGGRRRRKRTPGGAAAPRLTDAVPAGRLACRFATRRRTVIAVTDSPCERTGPAMKYLVLMAAEEGGWDTATPEERQRVMDAHDAFHEAVTERATMLAGEALAESPQPGARCAMSTGSRWSPRGRTPRASSSSAAST